MPAPPQPNFLTIADAKRWLSIDPADTTRDDILTLLVAAASQALYARLGWTFMRATWTETYHGRGGPALAVNQHPIIAVSALSIDAGQTQLDSSLYSWDDNLVWMLQGAYFPRGPRLIVLTYDAGLTAVPEWAQLAGRYTMKAMWDAKNSSMNAAGEQYSGAGSASYWPTGPGAVPPQAVALIAPYIDKFKVAY